MTYLIEDHHGQDRREADEHERPAPPVGADEVAPGSPETLQEQDERPPEAEPGTAGPNQATRGGGRERGGQHPEQEAPRQDERAHVGALAVHRSTQHAGVETQDDDRQTSEDAKHAPDGSSGPGRRHQSVPAKRSSSKRDPGAGEATPLTSR